MRPSLQYCLFFNGSTTISAWQHTDQEKPYQKHLIFSWIWLIMAFLPSILSHPFSRELIYENEAGFVLVELSCFTRTPWSSACHVAGHTAKTHLVSPKCSLSPCFGHAHVWWTMWTGLCCKSKSHNETLPQLCHPQWKGGNDRYCILATRDSQDREGSMVVSFKRQLSLIKIKILDINELPPKGIWIKTEFHSNKWTKMTSTFLLFCFQERRHTDKKTFPIHVRASTWYKLRGQDYTRTEFLP